MSLVVRLRRLRIQRSSTGSDASSTGAGVYPSRFMRANREAFQNLLGNVRPCSKRSEVLTIAPIRQFGFVDRHSKVLGFRSRERQGEPESIRPIELDDVHGVDAVALALRHPLALAILDHGMNEDRAERDVSNVELAEDGHPRDPQRDDVARRGEDAGRVVAC